MTAEVDAHGELSKCGGLDMTTYGNGNGNGNGKDDGDGSYVFVTGNDTDADADAVDAVAQTDLVENGDVVVNVNVNRTLPVVQSVPQPIQNQFLKDEEVEEVEEAAECDGDGPLPQLYDGKDSHSEESQINEEEKLEEGSISDLPTPTDTDVTQNQESPILVSEDVQNDLNQMKESAQFTNEPPLEDHGVDSELNLEMASCPVAEVQLQTEVVNGSVSDENGDSLPDDHTQDSISDAVVSLEADQITLEQSGSSEHAETLSSPDVCGNVPVETAESFTHEIPVEGQPEQNLESATCPVADIQSETEVVMSPVSDESREGLPTGHAQDNLPETIVVSDLVDANQNTEDFPTESQQDGSSEISETVEGCESLPTDPINDTTVEPDVENGAATITEDFPASADDVKTETEVVKSDVKSCETADSHPVDCTKVESEGNGGPADEDSMASCPTNDTNIESEVSEGFTECAVSQPIPVDVAGEEYHVSDSVENESSLPICSGADVKSEPEVDSAPAVSSSKDMDRDEGTVADSQVLNGSDVNSESAPNSVPGVVHVENGEIQFTSGDSDDKTCQEMEGIDGIHREETSTSSPEGSTVDSLEGQNVGAEVGKMPFFYLIKIPRYDDENLKEQIRHAQLQVVQKTQSRDAIRVEMQTKRATCKEYGENFETARSEGGAARDLLKSKRQEIDSVQSVINRVKNAMSVEDIDGRIRNMEHMIEHETLPLKEEKQFIREIKQLKQLREQISSNMGKQDEVQQALDQKDQIEERLKILRKEADALRANVLKAEAVTQAAKKKYYDECDKLNKLQAQFKAADDIRQEAYIHLQSLRKQSYEKNKFFYNYKDDVKAANDLAVKRDMEALQHLCVDQVARVNELWKNNVDFRKDYIRCNTRSTLRRLKTLDGRSLGPDEEPPVVPSVVNERVTKEKTVPQILTSEGEKQEQVVPVEAHKTDDKPVAKVGEQKTQTARSKKPAEPAPSGNVLATVSGMDEIQEAREEESKRTKEEEELARKAEELRKEEEAAKLKEQRRLEEKVKAKEALERKKRNADKAQARAALRAQKEAEQKEKEREKRARKKEKRKAGTAEDTNVTSEGESAPSSETPVETPKESETSEKPTTMTKRPQKPLQLTKQTKAKSIPLPLRNRGKRRMQSWMWVLLAALVVFALFLLGNSSFSFNFGRQRFSF